MDSTSRPSPYAWPVFHAGRSCTGQQMAEIVIVHHDEGAVGRYEWERFPMRGLTMSMMRGLLCGENEGEDLQVASSSCDIIHIRELNGPTEHN